MTFFWLKHVGIKHKNSVRSSYESSGFIRKPNELLQKNKYKKKILRNESDLHAISCAPNTFSNRNTGDVSVLTAFLTLKRFIPVCFLITSKKSIYQNIAYAAALLPVLCGTVHIWAIFNRKIHFDENLGIW